MTKTLLLTPADLHKLLYYDPLTGMFTHKARTPDMFADGHRTAEGNCNNWNARYAGRAAFTANHNDGYKAGAIFKQKLLAHRVAWAMVHGVWPDVIDHDNGVRDDNRIANLRNGTHQQNLRNCKLSKANKSGHTGVFWDKARGKWLAYIRVDNKHIHLGYTDDIEDAVRLRKAAEIEHGFDPKHGLAQNR